MIEKGKKGLGNEAKCNVSRLGNAIVFYHSIEIIYIAACCETILDQGIVRTDLSYFLPGQHTILH